LPGLKDLNLKASENFPAKEKGARTLSAFFVFH